MPTFDGDNLIMTLDATANQNIIDDWYGPWKDWMLSSPLNRKFPQLFLSEGGGPVDATKSQASYIRANNDAGWRVRPPEQDIEIAYTGNLVRTNDSLPIFIPTVGSYSTQVFNVQPIAQTAETSVNVVTGTALTAQETADAVWDEPIADHLDVGSTGEALANDENSYAI